VSEPRRGCAQRTADARAPSAPLGPARFPAERLPAVEALAGCSPGAVGAEGKGRAGGAVRSRVMPERDFCFRKQLFGKNKCRRQNGGLVFLFFESRVEFLGEKREKTTSQNSE